jgi:hypothetical protein
VMIKQFRVTGMLATRLEELGISIPAVLRRAAFPSVITLKPAIRYQFKTGQRDWPKT